jgi:hypothetical protein
MQIELSLACGIQETLVPTVAIHSGRFEVFGRSMPSIEMGGDVIDVIPSEGRFAGLYSRHLGSWIGSRTTDGNAEGRDEDGAPVPRHTNQPVNGTLGRFQVSD